MKNVFLFMLIGIIAIIVVVLALISYDPKTESWGSLVLGGAVGLLIVMSPKIIAYFKETRRKTTK